MERYVLRIWVYSTILKNETATMFFLKKTFSSIILIDMTAEEFVEKKHKGPNFKTADYHPSLYDKFRVELAKMLGTKTEYVDIFTLMNQPTLPRTLDIRYAVHGSP